jgi:hypothetical protein
VWTTCCCQPGIVCTRMSVNPAFAIRAVKASTPSKRRTLRHR